MLYAQIFGGVVLVLLAVYLAFIRKAIETRSAGFVEGDF